MIRAILPFFCALAVLFAAGPAAAQAESLGVFGAWTVFAADVPGGKVCYMVAEPASAKGNYTRRGEVRAFVTHRPAAGARDVFSYETGYTYQEASKATVTIGGKKFTLFTHENMAWADTTKDDAALARAIRAGSTMVVRGTSSRGTLTTDTFSLKGSSKAYKAMSDACGVSP